MYSVSVTWVVPLALGGFAVLLMATFTALSARKRHRQAPAVAAGPRILIHDINDDRCTGCDACVAVCPTNVLDLIANKSRVVRFEDCIQCEACMFACPTEALVMFPEGEQPPPLKIPEVDEFFQTAVAGQYLIGEVAGKPLVKNAANLGRAVVEHMVRMGLRPSAGQGGEGMVDVAIVGSGPGGLSAAMTCIQKGLSYVVFEKEQIVASTIVHYPKGKLVMTEPYDTQNLSFLPVFDSSKEELIPVWEQLIESVGLAIRRGESVETVQAAPGGAFEIRTTVNAYRAQRVVLSIGTRGKPRTLRVPGENLPKVFSLLDDPEEWRGKDVLVVGGGDSACEAAMALADAGAAVTMSYRGKGLQRAAQKNRLGIERYAAEGRIAVELGSQVVQFDPDSVTLALGDGTQQRYPNDAAFVLIGADPPVQWLERLGVHFVERPHQHQMGKTDDIVRRLVPRAAECARDAAGAAAQILGGSAGMEPSRRAIGQTGAPEPRGPRKWLRSATSIFSIRDRSDSQDGLLGMAPLPPKPGKGKKFEAPVPLSEFAKRRRRDSLTAGERTRILRMLRDEGGRRADEDSQVVIDRSHAFDLDFDSAGAAPAPPPRRRDALPKPASIVALPGVGRSRRPSGAPPKGTSFGAPPRDSQPPPPFRYGKKPLPKPFEETTRAVSDAELLAAVRNAPGTGAVEFDDQPTQMSRLDLSQLDKRSAEGTPKGSTGRASGKVAPTFLNADDHDDEATRLASIDKLPGPSDDRTRAVNIQHDSSLADVEWDLD
jgi:thioredoxin reductase/ferredoxin